MGASVRAVIGSVAVSDEEWATIVDLASLPVKDLAGGFCQAVKPTPVEVEANVTEYPGTTVEELNAYYDYVFAYVAPLCADLPPATDPKGASRVEGRQKWGLGSDRGLISPNP